MIPHANNQIGPVIMARYCKVAIFISVSWMSVYVKYLTQGICRDTADLTTPAVLSTPKFCSEDSRNVALAHSRVLYQCWRSLVDEGFIQERQPA